MERLNSARMMPVKQVRPTNAMIVLVALLEKEKTGLRSRSVWLQSSDHEQRRTNVIRRQRDVMLMVMRSAVMTIMLPWRRCTIAH